MSKEKPTELLNDVLNQDMDEGDFELRDQLSKDLQTRLADHWQSPPDPDLVKTYTARQLKMLEPYKDDHKIIYFEGDYQGRELGTAGQLRKKILAFGNAVEEDGKQVYPPARYFYIQTADEQEIRAIFENMEAYKQKMLKTLEPYADNQPLGIVWKHHARTEGFPTVQKNPKTGKKERVFFPLTAGELRAQYKDYDLGAYDFETGELGWRILTDDPEHFDLKAWEKANQEHFAEQLKDMTERIEARHNSKRHGERN